AYTSPAFVAELESPSSDSMPAFTRQSESAWAGVASSAPAASSRPMSVFRMFDSPLVVELPGNARKIAGRRVAATPRFTKARVAHEKKPGRPATPGPTLRNRGGE